MATAFGQGDGFRARLYRALEPSALDGRLSPLNKFLVFVVLASLTLLALETELIAQATEALSQEGRIPAGLSSSLGGILAINLLVIVVFAVEYVARVWAAGENPKYKGFKGRLRYMATPYALADLIAFLPELLLLLTPLGDDARMVAALKALRLLRLLKVARFMPAFNIFFRAAARSGPQLLVALLLAMGLVYVAAIALYLIEGDTQESFASIPRAIWWATATLTTVGYGDVYPITPWGKFAAGAIAIAGIGVVALPAGIFASAFNDELVADQEAKRAKKTALTAKTDTRTSEKTGSQGESDRSH